MVQYNTQDSRLAAFFLINGIPFVGTETRFQDDDDRVLLQFRIDDEEKFAQLKRDFFEGGLVPALAFANAMKSVMHAIREARELSRSSK
jgi:hypothetical protein